MSREPAPLPESYGAAESRGDPMKAGDGAVNDEQDEVEYIGLADGPDDQPEYEDLVDRPCRFLNPSTVREVWDGNRLITRDMPEWAAVQAELERQATPVDTDADRLRLRADLNDEIKLTHAAAMKGIDDPGLRLRADEALSEALREQPYQGWTARPTGNSHPRWGAELVLTPAGDDLVARNAELRPSGLLVTRNALVTPRARPRTPARRSVHFIEPATAEDAARLLALWGTDAEGAAAKGARKESTRRRDREFDLAQAVEAATALMQGGHQPLEDEVHDAVARAEGFTTDAIRSRWRRADPPITIGEIRTIAKRRAPLLHLPPTGETP